MKRSRRDRDSRQSCRLGCNATGSKQTQPSIQQFVTHCNAAAADTTSSGLQPNPFIGCIFCWPVLNWFFISSLETVLLSFIVISVKILCWTSSISLQNSCSLRVGQFLKRGAFSTAASRRGVESTLAKGKRRRNRQQAWKACRMQ